MILIKQERCTGCGMCLDVCPHGALYLLEGKAVVDEALCRECEVCVAACPEQAILISETVRESASAPSRVPAIQRKPDVIHVRTEGAPVPLRTRVLPVVGAALAWAGREIVPRLADYFLESWDRRATDQRATASGSRPSGTNAQSGRGGGRRRRRRHHGNRA